MTKDIPEIVHHELHKMMRWRLVLAGALSMLCSLAPAQEAADPNAALSTMMAKVQQYTVPGEAHQLLQRFVGEWHTETRLTMPGAPAKGETGKASFRWLLEGRWLQQHWQGQFLGRSTQGYSWIGYDNFKRSYVVTSITDIDTAMNHAEGDLDPGGAVLILYGTVDEYLTGEHDKMVKSVWRFVSEKEIVLEVHDLPIGEKNTQVIEVKYTRIEK